MCKKANLSKFNYMVIPLVKYKLIGTNNDLKDDFFTLL